MFFRFKQNKNIVNVTSVNHRFKHRFTVLNYESHKFKRLIKESLLVAKDKPLLNKQVKSMKLELFLFSSTYAIFYYLRGFVII